MLPFNLVIPPSRGGSNRKQSRRPAKGLTLTCTRMAPTRLHGGQRNLAVELKDVAEGGVRFVSSEPLEVPCSLALQVRDDATGAALQARGEIAWTRTQQVNGRDVHVVGAKFDEILSPPGERSWYFERVVAPIPKPWEKPATPPAHKRRAADRFSIADNDVFLERDHRFRESRKAGNLATKLLDLSRTGAHVACADPVSRGERVRLTLNLRTLQEIFTVEAETVWVRRVMTGETAGWHVGLAFASLNNAQLRQLQAMESWFRGSAGSSSRPNP